ncbi:taurine ABC transporter substrate-binding protein [Acinetobacter larvae]|uniref:Taurine ABC transporter substrate-binding protein n=1 Tax=Acinetobacter larvae TaxID=1789224 RepID=A0A1B2LY43_9GAMM|nr:taurine ABC transporter substrate-binding protein [Acinetobacter larvae]AOA57867.1 taurine ABC transporter substrate-binding protein [Acinetobacter larvae]
MTGKSTRPLVITAIVIIAIVGFIVYQNYFVANTKHTTTDQKAVVIAYQTGIDPSKVAQADGDYERDSARQIQWKKFDAGSDVINALASGDVVIGNIGSSPMAAAASQNLPVEVFFVASRLGESESFVVADRAKIKTAQDLIGKKIAVPFVSTTHYSLLMALKHWGIDSNQVKIINLRPPEIAAAWQRGDIDGAYVWEPTLSRLKNNQGQVLTHSKQVGEWGAPTYDLWVVRKDFAAKNPEFLKSFVKTSLKQFDAYQKDPIAYVADDNKIHKIAALTGSDQADVITLLAGNDYLNATQQQQVLQSVLAQNILDTAQFLKSQAKVDQVKADYKDYVTADYIELGD